MKIALIAHDKKKEDMINLAVKYREVLAPHELYATVAGLAICVGYNGTKSFIVVNGQEIVSKIRWY